MKINITRENAHFVVNEEKRKVICIFENTKNMFLDYIEDNLSFDPIYFDSSQKRNALYSKLRMPNRFIGIATCSPNDEFSPEIGKLIAYSRAKDKIHQSFFKRANTYVDSIDELLARDVENINRYGAKIEHNTAKRHDTINYVIGEPEE